MATGIKGICYKETSQLNEFNAVQHKNNHLRNFWDETRHFTRLSSTIFDNVIYESLYGCSVPGMPDDIMGGSAKRYSSVVTGSSDVENESKRRSVQPENGTTSDNKSVEIKQFHKEDLPSQLTETKSDTCLAALETVTDAPNTDTTSDKVATLTEDMPRREIIDVEADLSSEKVGQETDLSNGKISAANAVNVDDSNEKVPRRSRSTSELNNGRIRRNSSKIDITSTPLYKEIYANNLRQYGFLLAKKLGISNQSPKELRATYLQNRQKAELRRERTTSWVVGDEDPSGAQRDRSSTFADFGRRLSQCAPAVLKDRPLSTPALPTNGDEEADEVVNNPSKERPSKASVQRSSTAKSADNLTRQSTNARPQRSKTFDSAPHPAITQMRRSNTVEYLDRYKDKGSGIAHARSASDLTNKYSNSLTNISELFEDGKVNRPSRRVSCMERKKSCSPNSTPSHTPPLSNSSETIDKPDDSTETGLLNDTAQQKQHSPLFGTENEDCPVTPVILRRLRRSHDPHKRLSVPLLSGVHPSGSNTPRRLSNPEQEEEKKSAKSSYISSLSVPDLYHQSTFGKDKLMDTYCKQDVPRRKLSVDSLRRHNEAKERLDRRMSKLKSFDGVLTEADSFMKDFQTRNTAAITIPEEAIPE